MMSSDNKTGETLKRSETGKKPAIPGITDKQLQALSKKHLLMMIRDLEKELAREKEEKENLILACRAMLSRNQKTD